MKTVFINRKKYNVTYVFNIVGNYYFTDKHGAAHLVDAEDVATWADEEGERWTNGLDMAIKYARYIDANAEHAPFWWTVKDAK